MNVSDWPTKNGCPLDIIWEEDKQKTMEAGEVVHNYLAIYDNPDTGEFWYGKSYDSYEEAFQEGKDWIDGIL